MQMKTDLDALDLLWKERRITDYIVPESEDVGRVFGCTSFSETLEKLMLLDCSA
jgi:hypothetical protein